MSAKAGGTKAKTKARARAGGTKAKTKASNRRTERGERLVRDAVWGGGLNRACEMNVWGRFKISDINADFTVYKR